MEIPELDEVKQKSYCYNESFVKLRYPEFYNFLIKKYQFVPVKFTELLYLYFHNMDNPPICPECGKTLKFRCFSKGYRKFCSVKCQRNSKETKEKIKQTCIKKYNVEYPTQSIFVKEKVKSTNINRFGAGNPFQSEKIKEKMKKTKKERYGDENYINREKQKQTCLLKYGVDHPWKSPIIRNKIIEKTDEIQKKIYNTKKKNHTFNSSKIEEQFKQWLVDNNVKFDYQHKDDKYPFNCDFYFPDRDLYLEIQGHYTHGGHPFNSENKDDLKELISLQEKNYIEIIDVWTKRDPLKREIARKNNLNWIEVFTCDINYLIEKVEPLII